MKEEIELQVRKLVDLKLQHAGRASNLFWLGFGDIAEIIGRGRIEKIPGNNRFDERIKAFIKNNEQIKVLQIDSDEVGGLNIILSGGYKLEAFLDQTVQKTMNKANTGDFLIEKKTVLTLLLLEKELKKSKLQAL